MPEGSRYLNLFEKPIDQIGEADMQFLVDDEIAEQRHVEYTASAVAEHGDARTTRRSPSAP